jgi:shikimate kinase
VASVLAQRLGWKWLDADSELEAKEGRRISDIFARDGEAVFRDMEARVLAELCKLSCHVIATGGGVILRETNRERMRQTGRVVWLKAGLETIWARLRADAATGCERPPLTTGGRAEVEELLRIREPMYRACADLVVETGDRSPEAIAKEVAHWSSV